MKDCQHCGRSIPADATFCWYCTRELVARPERPAEEPAPTNWRLIGIVAGALIVAAAVCALLSGCMPAAATPVPTATVLLQPTRVPDTPTPTITPTPPPPTQAPTATPSANWQLVWADEFDLPDGSAVDPEKWSFNYGGGGWGNGEYQYYTVNRLENARIENGALVITALKEDYKNRHYTSARLNTNGKAEWLRGRFEIRAKMPQTKSIWPAIWMLPSKSVYGQWPRSGEIDILELLGHQPEIAYGTLHYGTPHGMQGSSYTLPEGNFAEEFHIFALEWDETEIRWFIDGHHYFSTSEWYTSSAKGEYPAPFDQPFYLVLNIAVGGSWRGYPDETTVFPQQMLVDYVRVYQK